MSITCPQGHINADGSRFCRQCRASLSQATMLQQKTQVLPTQTTTAAPLKLDPKTLLDRMTQVFGSAATAPVDSYNNRPSRTALGQPEDLACVIDVSGSMDDPFEARSTKLAAAQEAGVALLREKLRIDPQDRMAIVAFHTLGRIYLPLTSLGSGQPAITRAIRELSIDGGTDLDAGLETAEEALDWNRTNVIRRIVLLTDGHGGNPLARAQDLKSRGVVIDVVGVGPDPSAVNEELLREVASVVDGRSRYRFIRDRQSLTQHYTWIAQKTRIQ